ncbi:MAG: hypothetical protein ACSHYB_14345 [Roseibacillus sp.]
MFVAIEMGVEVSASVGYSLTVEITSEQIRQEAAECDARKVEQARRMSDRERFFSGVELFDDACRVSLAGLKAQNPTWSATALRQELKRLLKLADRMGK